MTQKNLLQSAGDGTAVPAGYVGEVISGTAISSANLTTSFQTISSITLTPGVWMLYYQITISAASGAVAGNSSYSVVRISDSSGTTKIGNSSRILQPPTAPTAASSFVESNLNATEIVNVTTTTTYLCQAKRTDSIGTGGGGWYNGNNIEESVFKAVRIA